MSGPRSLKRSYTPKVWAFVVAQVVILGIALSVGGFRSAITSLTGSWVHLSTLGLAPLLVTVLNGLITGDAKAKLVYWRYRDALPGCRAFSALGPRDSRVDMPALVGAFGPLPSTPADQNQLWYKVFKGVEDRPAVAQAHLDYLFTRDTASLAALALLLLLPAALTIGGLLPRVGWYAVFLVLQYLLLVLAARNYGNRFVCTVLAEGAAQAK